MTFNLAAPPDFRGLDPNKPIEIYTRNLPHWRQEGATYFITFNLADALPGPKKEELKSMRRQWEHQNPPPRCEETWTQYARTVFQAVENGWTLAMASAGFVENPTSMNFIAAFCTFTSSVTTSVVL